MFGKRRRAASSPAQRAPLSSASASASLAASKAFIRSAESNGDLSSAAAAAALRTHTTPPTPVGDTVTKRMARRGSLSSNGSSSRQPPGSLQRQSSSGSMTERSFRAPSPGRGSPPESSAPPVPPVPPVPADIQHQASGVRRRASSVEPIYRGASPSPRGGGRGVSLDRGASTSRRGTQRPANLLAHVSEEDTSRSINFSRPMSPGAVGNRQSPSSPTTSGWFGGPVINQEAIQRMASTSRPKTSSGVPSHHVQTTQRSVQSAAEQPVTTKRVAQGVEGTRLSSGSMRAKPSGTALQSQTYAPRQAPRPVDPNSPDAVYDPSTRTFIHKQDAMARHRELNEIPEPVPQRQPQHVETFHSVHIPENQRGRGSPSPIRHYIRQEQPVPQRRDEPKAAVQRNPDDFADAHVQTPEQANTSRRLEDSGYGTIVGYEDDTSSPVMAQNQDSAYPRISTPSSSRPTSIRNSNDHERIGRDGSSPLNPPRTAHFAPVATELTGLKHEPLPRSVSPAKSALKSSPSVSRRGESPLRSNGLLYTKGAPSEASDTASDDGGRRKKKNVRVSFEEDVVAGGVSAPAHQEPPKYGGLGASKWSPIAEKGDEFEDLKKPRPALPSFGSIRDKERRPREDVPEKVTEIVSTSPVGDRSGVSSDIALGNIVSEDHAQKQKEPDTPVPPEVTTVEGSGYVSDSSDYSVNNEDTAHKKLSQEPPAPEPKSLSILQEEAPTMAAPAAAQQHDVPDIAFQPATPSPYEKPAPDFPSIAIPGGWDVDATDPKDQGPKPAASTSIPSAQNPEPSSQPQQSSAPAEETTDDESSVYSDAYEDLSDGGGFASIDALMEKPVDSSPLGLMHSKHAVQEGTDEASTPRPDAAYESDDSQATQTQGWNAAQSHWGNVRKSIVVPDKAETSPEDSHAQEVVDRVIQAPVVQDHPVPAVSSPSPKPLKSALKKSPAPQTPQTTRPAEPQNRTVRAPAPRDNQLEVRLRRTMRGGPDGDAQPGPRMGSTMRSSMRGGPENTPRAQPQMRQSMRSGDTPNSNMGLAASRHSMIPLDTKPPRGALQKRNIPPSAAASKSRPQSMPEAKPKATPVPTYDSDSDASVSSFQRSRNRGSRQQGGRYTMRASMRQEPAPTLRNRAPAPKQVRAISPPVSPSPAMRRSMRPSSPPPEAVKSSRFSIRSLSPMGRFRKGPDVRPSSPTQEKPMPSFAKQPKPVKQKPQAAKVPFKSRFADSSDEEEDDRPRRFQSRFDDSDDEITDYELPPGLTPVRGIPRKPGEEDGDSTDLEEEVEEDIPEDVAKPAPETNGVNGTNGNANGQGTALAAGSLRDSKHATLPTFESGKGKKKRGFFGLGKKKTAQSDSVPFPSNPAQPASTLSDIPMPPVQRNRDKSAPMTPIDEDKEFGDAVPPSKRSPKLQRRSTPDWPLPPPPAIGTDNRPMSSDGVAPRRPRFTTRQPSAISNVSEPVVSAQGHSVSYGRNGKKKKFQGLRRVFGLND